MPKEPKISPEDLALLKEAMRAVKPLKQKERVEPVRPAYKRRKKQPVEAESVLDPLSDYTNLSPVSSKDVLEYTQSSIPHKVLRNLRIAQYNMDATLDLHGMTVEMARIALYDCILSCQNEGARTLLVIHGKGRNSEKPVLKNSLNHWLRQLDQVLAFCSTHGQDGMSGAICVLLKQHKGDPGFE